MSATAQTPHQQIALIDRQIDVTRWELHLRCPLIDTLSAASWQAAWDRNPQISARSDELYRQRGIAQQARDEAEHKTWQAQQRAARRTSRKAA